MRTSTDLTRNSRISRLELEKERGGGAPVSQSFADTIGADVYAPDAVNAVIRLKSGVLLQFFGGYRYRYGW